MMGWIGEGREVYDLRGYNGWLEMKGGNSCGLDSG